MTKRTPLYCPEIRERAVRMVFDHQGEHASQCEAIRSIAQKIGCSGETLRRASRRLWGRADLQDFADRPVDVPRPCGAAD